MTEGPNNMSQAAADAAYKSSFLSLAPGTQYSGYSGFEAKSFIDKREDIAKEWAGVQNERKALMSTSGGAGTAGYALVPVYLDPRMVDTSRKQTPLYEIMPKHTLRGLTVDYVKLTAKGAAAFQAENAALVDVDDTKSRASVAVKYLYVKGSVTGQAMATIPGFTIGGFQTGQFNGQFQDVEASNAMQQEVLIKGRAMLEALEDAIINGDASSNAYSFDGFVTQISTTNKLDKNTTALSLDDINVAIQYALDDGGLPKIGVCSTGVYTDLLGLISAKIGYLQSAEQVFWGFSTIVLNTAAGRIPVIWSRFMSNTSGSKSLYFLDLDVVGLHVLQDITYKPLAETNDSTPFLLKWYGCLVVKAPAFNSWIGEISG